MLNKLRAIYIEGKRLDKELDKREDKIKKSNKGE